MDAEKKLEKARVAGVALIVAGAALLLLATAFPLWQAHVTSQMLPDTDIALRLTFREITFTYPGRTVTSPVSDLSAAQQGALNLYFYTILVTAFLGFVAAAAAFLRYQRLGTGLTISTIVLAWAGPLAFTHYLPVAINESPLIPYLDYQFGFFGSQTWFLAKVDYGADWGWYITVAAAALITIGAMFLLWNARRGGGSTTNAFK
jgi:hypothetical protein